MKDVLRRVDRDIDTAFSNCILTVYLLLENLLDLLFYFYGVDIHEIMAVPVLSELFEIGFEYFVDIE